MSGRKKQPRLISVYGFLCGGLISFMGLAFIVTSFFGDEFFSVLVRGIVSLGLGILVMYLISKRWTRVKKLKPTPQEIPYKPE